jgi:hypothetical protein
MRIEDSVPESTSSDDDEESPYRQEPSALESPTQLLSARGRARISTQLAMNIVRAPERMTVMVNMRASQFLDRSPLRVVMRLTSM